MRQHDQVNHHHRQPDVHTNLSPDTWPSLPTTPDPMPPSISVQGPRPEPPRRYHPNGDWQRERDERERIRQQERDEQQRREYLWRKQLDLRLERQRLDAEEQALKLAWDTLPASASRIRRLIIALVILATIIAVVAFYPVLLIPLIIVLLIVGRFRRRRRRPFRQGTPWIEQERYRIQSRVAWIDARIASIAQEEQHLSQELLALTAQHHPQP